MSGGRGRGRVDRVNLSSPRVLAFVARVCSERNAPLGWGAGEIKPVFREDGLGPMLQRLDNAEVESACVLAVRVEAISDRKFHGKRVE